MTQTATISSSQYKDLKWKPVRSSMIRSVCAGADGYLYMLMHHGKVYRYNVDQGAESVAERLCEASNAGASLGKLWNEYFKGNYDEERVELRTG